MPYTRGPLSDFIKTQLINGEVQQTPLVLALNQTGLDIEGLSAVSCIESRVLHRYVYDGEIPTEDDGMRLDTPFDFPVGTFNGLYKIWKETTGKAS